jgi:hypothetical protein
MSIEAHGNSQVMRRTGWILSGIVIAFIAADAGSSLLAIAGDRQRRVAQAGDVDATVKIVPDLRTGPAIEMEWRCARRPTSRF